jgi:hypothetical protein
MTLVDAATAARTNGAAGPPAVARSLGETLGYGSIATEPEIAVDAAPSPAPPGAAVAVRERHLIVGFNGVSRRVLDPDSYVALRAEARRQIEGTTDSQYEIARRLDIKPTTLSYWKRREGWTRPPGAPLPPRLGTALPQGEKSEARRLRMIGRLYRLRAPDGGPGSAGRATRPHHRLEGCARAQRARQDTRNIDCARPGRRREDREAGVRQPCRLQSRVVAPSIALG